MYPELKGKVALITVKGKNYIYELDSPDHTFILPGKRKL